MTDDYYDRQLDNVIRLTISQYRVENSN